MGSPVNFARLVARAAARYPEHTAIEYLGETTVATSYAALLEDARRWAARLATRGVSRGDRVALLGDNGEPWIAAYLGALQLGAVAVPLDTSYRPEQVRTLLDHCGATLLCAGARFRDATAGLTCPVVSLETAGDAAERETSVADAVETTPDDPAVILYTSGTTADPKGVVLTHGNLGAERDAALAVVDCHDTDAVLGVLPLFHALAQMANLLVPLSVGARVVFLQTIDSSSLVAALQERSITIFACVPQFFYLIHQRVMDEVARAGRLRRWLFRALLATNVGLRERLGWNPGRRWFARVHRALGPRMRLLITGGSRFDPGVGRDLYGLGFTLLNGYGLTETSGAATVQRPRDRFTTSVGQPLPGVEVRIDGPSSEILIRGPIVMREYFERPDATADAVRDGWLHTGDLGWIDADGRVYVTGRQKELIVLSSGKNVYPEEIEAQYQRSAFVKEVCVMGRSDPGAPAAERLHAIVVPDEAALRARGAVNVRELIRFELEGQSVQLPPFKRVLSFEIHLAPLPRTATGKLKRHEIRQLAREPDPAGAGPAERPLTESERTWLADSSRDRWTRTVADVLRRDAVAPDAHLELDLGLDSMERVELLTSLEQRVGVRIRSDQRAAIFTVRQLVEALLSGGASTSEPQNPRTPEPQNPRTAESSPWSALLAEPPDPALSAMLAPTPWPRALFLFICFRVFGMAARLFVDFRVRGAASLDSRSAFVVAPNHQSYLDGLFVGAALPFHAVQRVFFVGASEYYGTRFSRWIARLANIVPVDPDANLVAAMQVSAAGLRANRILVLFPEGERTIDGAIKPFRKGAAILSAEIGVPIVPAALDGAYDLWPRSRPLNWRGLLTGRAARVTLSFAAPRVAARGAETAETAALQASVQRLFDELPRRVTGAS